MSDNHGSESTKLEPIGTVDHEEKTVSSEDRSGEGEFYAVTPESGNLLWSALSVIFAILSVILFAFFYIGGIVCAVLAIVFAIVSSHKLKFFDKMALFGLVFGVFSMIIDLTGILDGFGSV